MILRDYLETIIVPTHTTIEVIDNTGSMIGYVKLYTFSSMEAFFKRIKQYLDNEVNKVEIVPKETYISSMVILPFFCQF